MQDDANVWVRQPPDMIEKKLAHIRNVKAKARAKAEAAASPAPAAPSRKRQQRREVRGRNVHKPALNMVQQVFTIRNTLESLQEVEPRLGVKDMRGCRLACPTQIIPRANWATVRSRILKWNVWSSAGLGKVWKRSLPFGLGDSAVGHARWEVRLQTKDGIGTNECIVAEDQLGRRRGDPDHHDCQLDLNCKHHTGSLSTRPVVLNIGKGTYSAYLIRRGHLLECGRTFQKFMDHGVNKLIDDKFRLRVVPALTDSMINAYRKNRGILDKSSVVLDLDEDDMDFILKIDNDDWANTEELVHWHL